MEKDFMDLNDDEMNDWMDNKSDYIMSYDFRYCVACGRIVAVMDWDTNLVHVVLVFHPEDKIGFGVVEPDIDLCYGPFATSTPPDNFESDWDIDLVEPSQEELAEMNLQAEILLQELEG